MQKEPQETDIPLIPHPHFVSSSERTPKIWDTYFVLIDGVKNIMHNDEIDKYLARHPDKEILWLCDPKQKAPLNAKQLKKFFEKNKHKLRECPAPVTFGKPDQ